MIAMLRGNLSFVQCARNVACMFDPRAVILSDGCDCK